MTIVIKDVKKISELGFVRLESTVSLGDCDIRLWIETQNKWANSVEDSTADAFVVALLPTAMYRNEGIRSEFPLSEDLVYNINNHLLAVLKSDNSNIDNVSVTCDKLSTGTNIPKGVGTSFSLGVDSYHSVATHLKSGYTGHDLTHLLCFEYDRMKPYPYGKELMRKAEEASESLSLPLLEVWSNIPNVLMPPNLFASHTYWLASVVLTFGKLWHRYYVPSSYVGDAHIDILNEDCSHYESLLLGSLSTSKLEFVLDGINTSRFEKTDIISNLKITRSTLTPCWKFSLRHNCGYCSKCIRTIVDLGVTGHLKNYGEAFDLDYCAKMRKYFLMFMQSNRKNTYFIESDKAFAKNNPSEYKMLQNRWPDVKKKYAGSPNWSIEAAAADGYPVAMEKLSRLYLFDNHDWKNSVKWMKKASEADASYEDEYVRTLLDSKIPEFLSTASKEFDSPEHRKLIGLETSARILSKRLGNDSKKFGKEVLSIFEKSPQFSELCVRMLINKCQYSVAYRIASAFPENPVAKAYVGMMQLEGWGCKQDVDSAVRSLGQAFDYDCRFVDGYARALIKKGMPESLQKAFVLSETGARWGLPKSMYRLGTMYRDGTGTRKNVKKALDLLENASAKEPWYSNALVDLLISTKKKPNEKRAFEICSSRQGTVGMKGRLGRMYRDGIGCEQDLSKATELLRAESDSNPAWKREYEALLKTADRTETKNDGNRKYVKNKAIVTTADNSKTVQNNRKIKLGKVYTTNHEGYVKVQCDIALAGGEWPDSNSRKLKDERYESTRTLWIDIPEKYSEYIVTDRIDGFLVAALPFALINHYDIESEAPISEELKYNLTEQLLPPIFKYNPQYTPIELRVPSTDAELKHIRHEVGAGISFGVDSSHSIYENIRSQLKHHRLTILCDTWADGYMIKGSEKIDRFTKDFNIPVLTTQSNAKAIFKGTRYLLHHAFYYPLPVLVLGKMFDRYYYASSGRSYSHFSFEEPPDGDCCDYDLMTMCAISTSGLRFYSEAGHLTRSEKLMDLSKDEKLVSYLNCCWNSNISERHCCWCDKCKRTLSELDSLGILDRYREVFDVEEYENYKLFYIMNAIRHRENAFYRSVCTFYERKYPDMFARARKEMKLLDSYKIDPILEIAANNGSAKACYLLSKLYRRGIIGSITLQSKDLDKSVWWAEKAVEIEPSATNKRLLGEALTEKGDAVSLNRLIGILSDEEDPTCKLLAAKAMNNPKINRRKDAIALLKGNEDTECESYLSDMLRWSGKKGEEECLKILDGLSKGKDIDSTGKLALIYHEGKIVQKDDGKAFDLMRSVSKKDWCRRELVDWLMEKGDTQSIKEAAELCKPFVFKDPFYGLYGKILDLMETSKAVESKS